MLGLGCTIIERLVSSSRMASWQPSDGIVVKPMLDRFVKGIRDDPKTWGLIPLHLHELYWWWRGKIGSIGFCWGARYVSPLLPVPLSRCPFFTSPLPLCSIAPSIRRELIPGPSLGSWWCTYPNRCRGNIPRLFRYLGRRSRDHHSTHSILQRYSRLDVFRFIPRSSQSPSLLAET